MPLSRWTRVPQLEPRAPESHKGDFGKILIVAGSRGMAGAACLAAGSALRSGAGLVTVAIPEPLAPTLTAVQPCAMTLPLPPGPEGTLTAEAAEPILEFLAGCDALVLGPGMGRNPGASELVRRILVGRRCPAIVDADGLNNLSERMETLAEAPPPVVLTPHPGEMARLDSSAAPAGGSGRERTAAIFARRWNCILVLKGHRSVVSDGTRVYVNTTGNPGMASGGTGDVLAGMIGAFLGRKIPPFEASVLATFVHGLAGDLAAREFGEVSLIATDLLDLLPLAFRRHAGRQKGDGP